MATDQEIKKMHQAKMVRYDKSSLGAQIGGLTHDAVALVIHFNPKDMTEAREGIKVWLDILYDLAEIKKAELTEDPEERPL